MEDHQTPWKGRRSITTTWEGGALGGEEEGRTQRQPSSSLLEPVIGWSPSKPACSATLSSTSSSLQSRRETQGLGRSPGYPFETSTPGWRLWWPSCVGSKGASVWRGHQGLARLLNLDQFWNERIWMHESESYLCTLIVKCHTIFSSW